MEVGKVDALMTAIGLTAPVGYEYLYFILQGCIAIFLIMEVVGWLLMFFNNIFGR